MTTRVNPRWLVGRTIVAADMGAWKNKRGTLHNPELVLDNGVRLTFGAEEAENDDYGVRIFYFPSRKRRAAKERKVLQALARYVKVAP